MRTSLSLALLSAASLAACVPPPAPAESPDVFATGADEIAPWTDAAPDVVESPPAPEALEQRAARLQAKAILVDGHSAVPSLLLGGSFDRVSPGHDPTAAELARIKAAGVAGAFFSIRVGAPSPYTSSPLGGSAARRALDLVDATHRQIERSRGTMVLARSARDVRRAKREGRIAALLGIEGGHAIESSLPALRSFYRLGVRTMTLTHTTTNDWADSAGGALEPGFVRHRGLSPFGEAVVREMQRIGMLVDVSHASDSTFKAVMRVAKAPVITSSSMPASGHQRRDLDDYMLRAIAENGGLVVVNSWALFLDGTYAEQSERFVQKHGAHLKELGERLQGDPTALREELERLRAQEGPMKPLPLSRVVDHIDHVVKVAGIDHVSIGSSFGRVDGLEEGLASSDGLRNITLELVRRGYSDGDILSLLGGNFLRVLEQAEAHAASTETTLSGDGSARQLSAAELRDPPRPQTTLPPPVPSLHTSSRPRPSWWMAPPPAPPVLRRTKGGAPEPAPLEIRPSR
ncbi:dipeptidase [Sorangium cellulosum]|uniref:Dipeptidase n=2 Tax=Sorangium cellulosum TaxID=56 RepID=A0A2L0EK27_SORCE|nr:dipeptidase [Sorangium cellulosum]